MVLFNNERDRRNIFVDILAVLFGISSWISINGLWVELPLLVERLPEAWTLASYLSVIVQLANIGPITIGLVRYFQKIVKLYLKFDDFLIGLTPIQGIHTKIFKKCKCCVI